MSIDAVFKDTNIALKTFWETVLLDQDGKEISWTRPLITAVTTPKLKLTVNAVDGGAKKAYMGYELPDNITLTMYETVDRKVEKYLDDWMFGKNGVFDRETGRFRKRDKDKITNIYRGLKFITTAWKNDKDGVNANVKTEENAAGTHISLIEQEKSGIFSGSDDPLLNQARIMNTQQIASQLTAVASQAANQVLGVVPGMFMPRVVIPPPLLKLPAIVPVPIPPKSSTTANHVTVPESKQTRVLPEEDNIKTYKHEEKRISITTYTCSIEGYEPSSYDYESGGPVTYSVNLSLTNSKTEYC